MLYSHIPLASCFSSQCRQKLPSIFVKRCLKSCGKFVSVSVVISLLSGITDPTKCWPWIVKVKQLGGAGRCIPALGYVTASETHPHWKGMGVIWGFIAYHINFLATFIFFWRNRYVNVFLSRKCPFQEAFYLYHCYFSGIKRLLLLLNYPGVHFNIYLDQV